MTNLSVAASLRRWVEFVHETVQLRSAVGKALGYFTNLSLASGFFSWRSHAALMVRNRKILTNLITRMRHLQVTGMFANHP